MKKFLIALLAALLVVSMAAFTMATADGTSGEDPNYTGTNGSDKNGETKTTTLCDGNHDFSVTKTINANCTGNLVTFKVCSKCGAEQPGSRVETANTALGHLWDDVKVTVVSTGDCQTPGKVIKTCKRCGATQEFNTEGAHKYTEWTAVTKETCVTAGLYKRYCTVCEHVDIKEVPATGKHLFADKYVKTRATCTTWGTYEAQCTMCGKYFTYKDLGDNDATAIKDGTIALKIAKRNHKMGEAVVKVKPTCKVDGLIESVCLNTNSTELYEACNYKEQTVIPASTTIYNPAVQETTLKYHNLVFVPEVKATATTKAIGYYKCSICGWKSKEVVEYSGNANAVATTAKANGTTVAPAKTPAKSTSSSTNKKGVSIPKTNDTTSNLPYVLIAVAFVGLVALVASKKKVNG